MAKKFFYNRVYNTKRTIIHLIIIGVCVIGIIVCFIFTTNLDVKNQNKPNGELNLKSEVTVEINEEFSNEIFFSKIENVSLDDIEVNYPENFDISTPGVYEVSLVISKKTYITKLNVVDTIKPTLDIKELTIKEGEHYSARDFVTSCTDNSNNDCIIDYATAQDEEGNIIDYSSYKTPGTYPIKIIAKDKSDNEIVKETTLIIENKNGNTTPEKPTICKYGNNEYDENNYLMAVDVTNGGCAISLDLYKNNTTRASINKLMETETVRIKKDIDKLNLPGTKALNRQQNAVINKSGNGIVGYELIMTVVMTNNGSSEVIAEYKVNSEGKRIFINNKYNLSE